MSKDVKVAYGDSAKDTATLLLAAAEELDLDPGVVRTSPFDSAFLAPEEVAKKAGVDIVEDEDTSANETPSSAEDEGEKKPAKKAAAKKSTSKES